MSRLAVRLLLCPFFHTRQRAWLIFLQSTAFLQNFSRRLDKPTIPSALRTVIIKRKRIMEKLMTIDFMTQAQVMREELIARRRDFHSHPELAFQEVRTAGIVAKELNALGLEVSTGVGKTGVVAILEGKREGPTVLVRCDMDALPILEANKTDYISQEPGKMHACGHDGHTAIGLAVAKMLT